MLFKILRVGLLAATVMILILAVLGIKYLSNAPYSGIVHRNLVIQMVNADSPNTDPRLKPGYKILAVDGKVVRNISHYNFLTYQKGRLTPQTYMIAGEDSVYQVDVKYIRMNIYILFKYFINMLVGFTFLIVGFKVISKCHDMLCSLFTINCIFWAIILTIRPVTSIELFHIAGELIYDFLFAYLPAVFLHFFIIFVRIEILKERKPLQNVIIIYTLPSILFIVSAIVAIFSYLNATQPVIIYYLNYFYSYNMILYVVLSVVVFIKLIVFIKTHRNSTKEQRTAAKIVWFNIAVGIITMVFIAIKPLEQAFNIHFGYLLFLIISFMPVSFAYGIIRYDVFHVSEDSRRDLASAILIGMLVSLYFILQGSMSELFASRSGSQPLFIKLSIIFYFTIMFVIAKKSMLQLVDWLFFRKRNNEINQKLEDRKRLKAKQRLFYKRHRKYYYIQR